MKTNGAQRVIPAFSELLKQPSQVNECLKNIGSQRLRMVMGRLMVYIYSDASKNFGETFTIVSAYVDSHL